MNPLSIQEIVALASVDDEFYCRTFFPKTYRQGFPAFHNAINQRLQNPQNRYVAWKMFRGSAKTTRLRTFVSKRIAYGISRTILFVSNSQKHSVMSLKWLKKQIEFNQPWAGTFGLTKGATWNDEHIEIVHALEGYSIAVLALGITGQIRGVNIDDYRPDLIVLDDPDNEETTNTHEQREKTGELVFGALQNSLTPPTENPAAKMVLLQTPLNKQDLIAKCAESPDWHTETISCFDVNGESTWEDRFPTKYLQAEKQKFVRLRKLPTWTREMECSITSTELSAFDASWLKFWDETGLPSGLTKWVAIDPASIEGKEGKTDDQVCMLVGFLRRDIYVIEYSAASNQDPDELANYFIGLLVSNTVVRTACESVAYQKILAWYLEKKMRENRKWCIVDRFKDQRKKSDRIVQTLREPAAAGNLYVHSSHTKLIQQFTDYRPNNDTAHDDVIDALSIAIASYRGRDVLDADFERLPEEDVPQADKYERVSYAP